MGKRKIESNFIAQGSILAIAGIITRIIGLIYRVPLLNIMGQEAYGVYSSAYNIYSILLLLSSYSLPLAVSKMVAARMANGEYRNASRVFKSSLLFALIAGGAMCLICFFGADFFAVYLIKMPDAAFSIKILAPIIFVMAFLSVFRGYYQGLGTMIPTATSQILEQIFNAAFSVLCAWFLIDRAAAGDKSAYGAAGATLGTGIGALAGLILCIILFNAYRSVSNRHIKRDQTRHQEEYPALMKALIAIAIPVILSGTVYNISSLVDNSIYGYYMDYAGLEAGYKSIFGTFSGIYLLMVNVPVAISNALSSSVIPSLTEAVTLKDRGTILTKVSLCIRVSMLIAIPAAIGMGVLAKPIVGLLFSSDNGLGADLLTWGSLAIVFFSLSTITNAVLQGINRTTVPVRNATISLVIHIGLLFIFLYGLKMDIYGVVLANMLFGLSMCILNGACIADYLQYRQEVKKTFVLPAICSLIMGIVAWLVYNGLHTLTKSNALSLFVAMIIAIVLYFVLLLVTKCVDEAELYGFPMGGRMVSLAKKLHLL